MSDFSGDTSLGGAGRAFPATTQGFAARFAGLETQGYQELLGDLAARYWRPVYTFIRVAWKKGNEDAKDLTQAFFTWLTEREALRAYVPGRGGFRVYLKVLLRSFLGHDATAAQRLKRGGGTSTLRMDDDAALDEVLPDPASADPDRLFDQAWVVALMKGSVDRVRQRLLAEGRALTVKVFEAHDLEDGGSYSAVAARLSIKESQVRDHLFAFRALVRAEMRRELVQQTRDDAELEEEWRVLFGS